MGRLLGLGPWPCWIHGTSHCLDQVGSPITAAFRRWCLRWLAGGLLVEAEGFKKGADGGGSLDSLDGSQEATA